MPFCPKCRAEYREGFTKCHDCQLTLVDKLTPEKTPKETSKKMGPFSGELVMIYTTPNQGSAAFVKSLLEASNIPCFVKNENVNYTLPPGLIDGFAWMEILVSKEKAEQARELLKDFLNQSDDKK